MELFSFVYLLGVSLERKYLRSCKNFFALIDGFFRVSKMLMGCGIWIDCILLFADAGYDNTPDEVISDYVYSAMMLGSKFEVSCSLSPLPA